MAIEAQVNGRRAPSSRRSLLAGATGLLAGAGAMGVLARPQAAAAATLAGAGPDWINITAAPYNADPTGSADSTAGIQAALNQIASNGGGTLYIPAGNFKLTSGLTYTSTNALMVTGDGPQASNLRLAGTAASVEYLSITMKGTFTFGDLGNQGTVIIENVSFYNDQPPLPYTPYTTPNAAIVLNGVNFGQIRNLGIYNSASSNWMSHGIILNGCNQVDIDNANLFVSVNGVVTTGYSQVNNLSNTSIWMKTTGTEYAAAILYIGQTLTANIVSVICHDGDRGVYFTQDANGAIPHLLFAFNLQPNNHQVAAVEIDYGAQAYFTECFFSAGTHYVDLAIPQLLFGPEWQGSATAIGCQFLGGQGHVIDLQGGQGFYIQGCEIGGGGEYKYAANTYDEIHIGAAVSEVTIDTCHFDIDTLATTGTSNPPRSAIYVEEGAANVIVSNCIAAAADKYATAPFIDNTNAAIRNSNIGLGLGNQVTGAGSTVTGTSAANLSAAFSIPPYDMTVGAVYRLTAFGHGTGPGNASTGLQPGITLGGTSLGTFTAAGGPKPGEGFTWSYTAYLAVTGVGASGTIVSNETFTWDGDTTSNGNNSFTVDTTKANTLALAARWTSASASPTITCDYTTVERVQNTPVAQGG